MKLYIMCLDQALTKISQVKNYLLCMSLYGQIVSRQTQAIINHHHLRDKHPNLSWKLGRPTDIKKYEGLSWQNMVWHPVEDCVDTNTFHCTLSHCISKP